MKIFEANSRLTPFLWFAKEASEAATFYTSIFPNSKILATTPAKNVPNFPSDVLTVEFELDGQRFIALNGNSKETFNLCISFAIRCEDQKEIDHYWEKLTEGGSEIQCGWLKDRYGVPWQVVPADMPKLIGNPKGMQAMMRMKKIDIAELKRAGAQ